MAACALCLLQGCAASFSGPACTPQPQPAPSRCRQYSFYVPAQGLFAILRLPSWVFVLAESLQMQMHLFDVHCSEILPGISIACHSMQHNCLLQSLLTGRL